MEYKYQFEVLSTDGKRRYKVSLASYIKITDWKDWWNQRLKVRYGEQWQCSCVGWVKHFPRRDCKHIRKVKETHWFGEDVKI